MSTTAVDVLARGGDKFAGVADPNLEGRLTGERERPHVVR